MLIDRDLEHETPAWLRHAPEASILSAIHEPGVELVLWRRTLPPRLRWWLEQLPYDQLPHGRILCRARDLRGAATALLRSSGPLSLTQELLLDDMVKLGRYFARVSGSDLLDLSLEPIDDNGCAAFHRDRVELRLLTTYRGPGTEWVEPQHANQALAAQSAYAGPIERAPFNAVIMLRGANAAEAMGLVHRSSPIEGTDATRLLLCLNTPSDVSPALWRPGDRFENVY